VAAVAEQDGTAVERRRILGGPGHGREERVADVEHDEADGPAVAGAELPGGVVAHETEFLDGLQDAVLGARRNPVRIIQDIRYRAHCHAGVVGDIFDAG
jgi:hypothetical protein